MSHPSQTRFIAYLTSIAPAPGAGVKGDRAALATLRRGLGKPPNQRIVMLAPLVGRFVPGVHGAWESDAYYMVAALFATHPHHSANRSLVQVYRTVVEASKSPESMERRFQALLDAEHEDLEVHLRHLVSLVAREGLALNWEGLLRDCCAWSHPDRYVQARWAREFWTFQVPRPAAETTAN